MESMIGERIITNIGEGTVVAESVQGHGDTCINLYLCEFADGHNDVVAQDNASNWVVGDENDSEANRAMVETIGSSRLDDFAETVVKHHDETLYGWILDRISDSADLNEDRNAFASDACRRTFFTANDAGEIGCHDCDRATAEANCEAMQAAHPDEGWEVMDASN